MPRRSAQFLAFAKRGAEARYRELLDELKMLTSSFPHLRDAFDRDELPINFLMREGSAKAARKASGSRKAYWVKQKRQAKKQKA